ncbi:hypothetical protein [Streptomyces sp. FXY-T5]|uniref:ATP-dependent DNA ligase n=1 Tax=Streptomyces sp. FXY-T5 TaxID=3064901 RepID=UPI0027D2C644|nr:hypothetical protein [Streptomyces sp. FXY-T5]WMD06375.1 hypothetical protein Q7C01_19130 [Streptomyces sp. FXY-T5]
MTWTLPEPMLTTPVSVPDLRPGCAAEPQWDGFRALVSVDAGQVVLRSRRGTEMRPSFPEVVAGAVRLPDATALDGELVVWDAAGRLAFERLQNRLQRRGAGAARAAEEWPAHFVDRAAQKIRRQEQGHQYAEGQLIALGAPVPRAGCSPALWLREALAAVGARNVRHRGAHRFCRRFLRVAAWSMTVPGGEGCDRWLLPRTPLP